MAETPSTTTTCELFTASRGKPKRFPGRATKGATFFEDGLTYREKPKKKKNLNAKRLHLFQHFMIFSFTWFCSQQTSKILKKGPPKKERKTKNTIRPHPRTCPHLSSPQNIHRIHWKTRINFHNKKKQESKPPGPQTISRNTHMKHTTQKFSIRFKDVLFSKPLEVARFHRSLWMKGCLPIHSAPFRSNPFR